MGIFEYLFERKNPGNVGDIKRNKPPMEQVGIVWIIIKLIISIILIYGAFHIIVLQNFSLARTLVFILIFIGYCLISYNFVPRPDTSNMGLLGGLIDHPFKFTDDFNRSLLALFIVMYPGRFIATSIVQTLMIMKKIARDRWKTH